MTRCVLGIPICFAAIGCGGGGPGTAFAPRVPGVAFEGVHFLEERDGRPAIDVRARTARVDPKKRDAAFEEVEARFDLPEAGSRGVLVTAARGRLRDDGRWLDLEGRVRARDDAGRTLATERLSYDLQQRILDLPVAVSAASPRGWARSPSARFELRLERVSLWGGVTAEIRP